MLSSNQFENFFKKGISFENYLVQFNELLTHQNSLSELYRHEYYNYYNLNLHRISRVEKLFQFNMDLKSKIEKISKKQHWLVLSEFWCGDAAQILPALNLIALTNSLIEFKILYRDENLELMDEFLTSGGRSIPKLIILDEKFNFVNQYGPRPKIAQDLVLSLKSKPETADNYAQELHLWYARNKSIDLQKELLELF